MSCSVGISTITFRNRPLEEALSLIQEIGAAETELGAIPEVVDHVPVPFTGSPRRYIDLLAAHGLSSGAVNSDVGDLNDPGLPRARLAQVADPLIALAAATGGALIVPCGRANWEPFVDEVADLATIASNLEFLASRCEPAGVRLLVEVLHHKRYIHTVRRADRLLAMTDAAWFGHLFDVAHIGASEEDAVAWAGAAFDRIERVHLRDAVPGNLNIGIGRGNVDFAGVIEALESRGYGGSYILELETHDVKEQDRLADAKRSFDAITGLLAATLERLSDRGS